MGVPGLARRLEPYATHCSREQLRGYSAIIDGPALAYHAHKLATITSSSPSRLPTYADINDEAIRWLNSLEEYGIKVSEILFDGALPQSKRLERLQRHEQNNRRVQQFRASYPLASCPIPSYLGAVSYAFLAPSLREILSLSKYASRTSSVPGEADDYCASKAKQIPESIILTSDTDLVLYDYPHETLILFFSEADLPTGVKAYSPAEIRTRLQLNSLVKFAFALRDGHHDTASDLAANARKVDTDSTEYTNFNRRYITITESSPPLSDQYIQITKVPLVDVRVSEFVHQALNSSMTPLVYLPLLIEDPNQASAWIVCQDLRTMAYSLLAQQAAIVQEYKRKAQGIAVQEINVYSKANLLIPLNNFLEGQLKPLKKWAASKNLSPAILWPLFALSLTLPELNSSPAIPLVLAVLNTEFDHSWSYIQLQARLQAAMYSLRMLKQIIAVHLALDHANDQDLQTSLANIDRLMQDFPTIGEMFTIPGQPKRVLAGHEQLKSMVEEIYGSVGVEVPVEHVSNKKKKRQAREADRKKRKAEQRQQTGPPVGNAYAPLK
ncbi:hypothetical protein ACN47E_005781 [Coniothyrium glycines]